MIGTLTALLLSVQPMPPEAKDVVEERQRDLITLSGHLGALHRLWQICGPNQNVDIYRDRMQQLIPLEAPPLATREAMIQSFNANYRLKIREHLTCGPDAWRDHAGEATAALVVVSRLAP